MLLYTYIYIYIYIYTYIYLYIYILSKVLIRVSCIEFHSGSTVFHNGIATYLCCLIGVSVKARKALSVKLQSIQQTYSNNIANTYTYVYIYSYKHI